MAVVTGEKDHHRPFCLPARRGELAPQQGNEALFELGPLMLIFPMHGANSLGNFGAGMKIIVRERSSLPIDTS